jgi:hypothetical protein
MFPRAGMAAPLRVAIAAFDYADTSGEARDEVAVHAARLGALSQQIRLDLASSGSIKPEPFRCSQPRCSAGALDQDDMLRAARAQRVQYLVFGGVHKMSTLIQWGQVEVMNVQSGKLALSRTISFRGDSDDAWQHAAGYIAQMVADQLH